MYPEVSLIKKRVILFCSLRNMRKQLCLMNICLSIISFGRYLLENVVKNGGNWEEDINEDVTNNAIFKVHFFAIIIYIDMVN